MQRDEITAVIQALVDRMPESVMEALGDVEMVVCDSADDAALEMKKELRDEFNANEIPADCKGVFLGNAVEIEESDESEDEEVVLTAEGFIVLVAANIKDADEAALVLLHEIGHALDMDEQSVRDLGLGVRTEPPTEEKTNVPTEPPITIPPVQ